MANKGIASLMIFMILFYIQVKSVRSDDQQENIDDETIETMKRLLFKKKTSTTPKPTFGVISGLVLTSPRHRLSTTTDSPFGGGGGRKSDSCGLINPCQHGGTCRTLSNGKYFCFCSSEHYGKNCEHQFRHSHSKDLHRSGKNHCANSPCRHGGECVSLITTYYCRCQTPYYGINCDKTLY